MRTILAVATLPLVFLSVAPAIGKEAVQASRIPLGKVDVLPLALDDRYQFRKVQEFLNDPLYQKATADAMVAYERQRVAFGAITNDDRLEVRGHYFGFFWRTRQPGPVTIRLEYRQANLGSYVQAREVAYDNPRGTVETKFQITGDDYNLDGRVIAWRALLIADGKIVGLTQSYLWD